MATLAYTFSQDFSGRPCYPRSHLRHALIVYAMITNRDGKKITHAMPISRGFAKLLPKEFAKIMNPINMPTADNEHRIVPVRIFHHNNTVLYEYS